MTTDPSAIRAVAVSADDLVAAMEAAASGGAPTVLRITPPFSGRMRARLHVVQDDTDDETVHLPPATLLTGEPPAYPSPDETADELRAAADETYSVERHREYHRQRVQAWRTRLLDHVAESTTVSALDAEISVSILGP